MTRFVNGYLVEYICGYTYVTVTSGHVDEFGRFIGEKMVYRSEDWDECCRWAEQH